MTFHSLFFFFFQLNSETKRVSFQYWKTLKSTRLDTCTFSYPDIPTLKSHLEIRYDLSRNGIYTFTETRTFLEDKRGTGSTIALPRLFLRFPFHSTAKNRPHRAGLDRIGKGKKRKSESSGSLTSRKTSPGYFYSLGPHFYSPNTIRRRLSYAAIR